MVVACNDPVAPDIDFLEISVTVSEAKISRGEVTEVRATLTNPTGRLLSFGIGGCVLLFEMRDRNDNRFVEPVVCEDRVFEHVLAPGDSIHRTVSFDGTGWLGLSGAAAMPSGSYRVRAGMSFAFLNPSPFVALKIRASPP
jgi:hypothetical protein